MRCNSGSRAAAKGFFRLRLNWSFARELAPAKERMMTDHKKKGDFDQARKGDVGGNKKQDNSDNTPSRTGNQNAGHGGRS
jgi:hypothetical protein